MCLVSPCFRRTSDDLVRAQSNVPASDQPRDSAHDRRVTLATAITAASLQMSDLILYAADLIPT